MNALVNRFVPTVIRFNRCRIEMYFDDHPPPHFTSLRAKISVSQL
jgi:hypothetical protein